MAPLLRWGLRGGALLALILGGHQIMGMVTGWLDVTVLPHTEGVLHGAILGGTAVYVVLMAIPFVPGAEIGLTLLTALGGVLAPLIYLATATSLTLAYLAGRLLPADLLRRGLAALGLHRAAGFVTRAAAMTEADLQQHLTGPALPRALRAVLRYRYVTLALLINMPGNVVLGGGGGIAMMAGLSRLFKPVPFVLTVLLAVLPVPLLFYLGTLQTAPA